MTPALSKNLKLLLILCSMAFLLLLGATAAVLGNAFFNKDRLVKGLAIEQVEVGGLSRQEALLRLERQLLPALQRPITIVCAGQRFRFNRTELGADVMDLEGALDAAFAASNQLNPLKRALLDWGARQSTQQIQVEVRIDKSKLSDVIHFIADRVQRPPRNAEVTLVDGEIQIKPGETGLSVDIPKATQFAAAALANPLTTRVDLPWEEEPPSITTADVASFDTILGQYTTKFRPWEVGRTHNLKLASSKLDNTLIRPGEIFSLNATRGPTSAEAGYREAYIYRNGRVEPAIGGGICQVASTIYNAALRAGLEIIERANHMFTVDYVPLGLDATVYYGVRDLKFRNDLEHPVLLKVKVEGNRLSAWIIGNSSDQREVKIQRWGFTTTPFRVIEKPDPSLKPGQRKIDQKGHNGHTVHVRITVLKDGKVLRITERVDKYRVGNKIILVGVSPSSKTTPESNEEQTEATSDGPPSAD